MNDHKEIMHQSIPLNIISMSAELHPQLKTLWYDRELQEQASKGLLSWNSLSTCFQDFAEHDHITTGPTVSLQPLWYNRKSDDVIIE